MLHKIKMLFLYVCFLFNPMYHNISFNRLILSFYTKFGLNKKEVFTKLNKRYCQSFYKFFSKIKIDDFLEMNKQDVEIMNNCVFFYRNDGQNTMPKIVRMCYENLKKTTKFPVIFVDFDSCRKYAYIPEFIYTMLKDNKISRTNFSEILRMNLLSIHNDCIWVDATCFLFRDFPDWIFECDFLTIYPDKGNSIFDGISRFNWAPDLKLQQSYFLAGKDKLIFKKIYNFYISYLKSENKYLAFLRPYYLMYFIFEYLYNSDMYIYNVANKRRKNNTYCERIEGFFNEIYTDKDFNKYFNSDTFLYKLSYKVDFRYYKEGNLTNFGKLLELKNVDYSSI